jgi:hypothetical protein
MKVHYAFLLILNCFEWKKNIDINNVYIKIKFFREVFKEFSMCTIKGTDT